MKSESGLLLYTMARSLELNGREKGGWEQSLSRKGRWYAGEGNEWLSSDFVERGGQVFSNSPLSI
jgi:hypothetical protein